MSNVTKENISGCFQILQESICKQLEKLDGKSSFEEDMWSRKEGGGGRTQAIKNGDLIEKGGVNFSAVYGPTPVKILNALKLGQTDFFATGVSIILHSKNPWVPIIHMNIRYFEMSNDTWWFGGGLDLTPHMIIEEKAKQFHFTLKKVCDRYSTKYYPKFKDQADEYFYIHHRKETRGIGGIFFDRLNESDGFSKLDRWNFVQELGNSFIQTYTEAVEELRDMNWSEEDKSWQLMRRGRYVEFNLLYDKGTKFGLDTDGRTESILVSMPPTAQWEYDHRSQDQKYLNTLSHLKKGIDWIDA